MRFLKTLLNYVDYKEKMRHEKKNASKHVTLEYIYLWYLIKIMSIDDIWIDMFYYILKNLKHVYSKKIFLDKPCT